jgi:RimJ/RimL family protein N-acetyltransferase
VTAHPLAAMLDAAARGSFPPADGRVDVLPPPPGRADAMIGFTGHFALAAPIDPAAVTARVPPGDFSVPMSPPFLTWVAEQLRTRPTTFDALLAAFGTGAGVPAWLHEVEDSDHPRVQRASRYRTDMRLFTADTEDAVLVVGRGICGRWEIGYEVDEHARNAGLGRRIVRAARDVVPEGEVVWAQVAPGNAASMRSTLGGGFSPVAAEVLFPRAPQ